MKIIHISSNVKKHEQYLQQINNNTEKKTYTLLLNNKLVWN